MLSNIFNVTNLTYFLKYLYLLRFILLLVSLFAFIYESNLKKNALIPIIFIYVHLSISLAAYIYLDNKQKDNLKYNGLKDAVMFYLLGYVLNIGFGFLKLNPDIYNYKF